MNNKADATHTNIKTRQCRLPLTKICTYLRLAPSFLVAVSEPGDFLGSESSAWLQSYHIRRLPPMLWLLIRYF
jgi:hypothetical protein